jgi:hypothetical protein
VLEELCSQIQVRFSDSSMGIEIFLGKDRYKGVEIMIIILRGCRFHILLFRMFFPQQRIKPDYVKDSFYEELEQNVYSIKFP